MKEFKVSYKVRVFDNGTKYWYFEGQLHREDGPAAEYADGTKYWFLEGKVMTEEAWKEKLIYNLS